MPKPVVVGFLQNAWSPLYANTTWPRNLWLDALERSRSGIRLQTLVDNAGDDIDFWFDNTTPEVGNSPDSALPPSSEHITKVLNKQKPIAVLALGKQAAEALIPVWDGPLLCLPHPACRVVTNKLYIAAGRMLRSGFTERCIIKQLEGKYKKISLNKTKV